MADDAFAARQLLRAARAATLATQTGGQPFTALVTPATAPDLSILLWLSSMSEHTRHLAAEPRCAVMVTGERDSANPQTAPRLTVTGLAERLDDTALKARWLALHPYAALYADFADFALWRIRPAAAHFVAGFARATRLRRDALLPDPNAVATLAAAEADIIAHCNTDHAAAMAELAGVDGEWHMVALDPDGFDLACADSVRRIPWSTPIATPDAVRAELIAALHRARRAAR
jgi:putative heme iron utilization protein